jgi:DNA-binding response OmpR family regulator
MKQTRILYLEDEIHLGKIVKETLELKGYEVAWHISGAEVLQAAMQFQPELCILDVMVPGLDGLSVAQQIRQVLPSVPIIFLTAKSQTQDVLNGFAAGGNDYIRKPFSLEELFARVQNLLKLTPTAQPQVIDHVSIGQFQFFPHRQELVFGQTTKRLSHKENQLLVLLSANMGETVQRKTLLDAVWGNDSFFNSRTLDVYITKLREHLKEDAQVQIITLKGVGYRLLG